jgi:hypothetical protein
LAVHNVDDRRNRNEAGGFLVDEPDANARLELSNALSGSADASSGGDLAEDGAEWKSVTGKCVRET